MTAARTPSPRAAELGLLPHPEGGWYRSTWHASHTVEVPGVGERAGASLILFLLEDGDESAWHVVRFDEIWLWHGPDAVVLELGGTGATPTTEQSVTLGAGADAVPQFVVPAGVWQRALPVPGSALVSCVVSPGFTYDDWRLAPGIAPKA